MKRAKRQGPRAPHKKIILPFAETESDILANLPQGAIVMGEDEESAFMKTNLGWLRLGLEPGFDTLPAAQIATTGAPINIDPLGPTDTYQSLAVEEDLTQAVWTRPPAFSIALGDTIVPFDPDAVPEVGEFLSVDDVASTLVVTSRDILVSDIAGLEADVNALVDTAIAGVTPGDIGAAPAVHNHAQSDVTGLSAALTAKADASALTAHTSDATIHRTLGTGATNAAAGNHTHDPSALSPAAATASALTAHTSDTTVHHTLGTGSTNAAAGNHTHDPSTLSPAAATASALTAHTGNTAIHVPAGGTDGQVLKKVSGSPAWAAESGGGGGSITLVQSSGGSVTVTGGSGPTVNLEATAASVGAAAASHSHAQSDVTGLATALAARVTTDWSGYTNKTTPVAADEFLIADSADSGNLKSVTLSQLGLTTDYVPDTDGSWNTDYSAKSGTAALDYMLLQDYDDSYKVKKIRAQDILSRKVQTGGAVLPWAQDPAYYPFSGQVLFLFNDAANGGALSIRAGNSPQPPTRHYRDVNGLRLAALPAYTASGYPGTLTATANGALGYTTNDLIIINGESDSNLNGVYIVTQPGDASTPFILNKQFWFSDPDNWAQYQGGAIYRVGLYDTYARAEFSWRNDTSYTQLEYIRGGAPRTATTNGTAYNGLTHHVTATCTRTFANTPNYWEVFRMAVTTFNVQAGVTLTLDHLHANAVFEQLDGTTSATLAVVGPATFSLQIRPGASGGSVIYDFVQRPAVQTRLNAGVLQFWNGSAWTNS